MDLLLFLLILLVWVIYAIINALTPKSNKVLSSEEHDQLLRELVGKSKKERKEILKKYYK